MVYIQPAFIPPLFYILCSF